MKIRKGFVSNSSSSSFVCDLCGESNNTWNDNGDPFDARFVVCESGHILCMDHVHSPWAWSDVVDRHIAEHTPIPKSMCPMCYPLTSLKDDVLPLIIAYIHSNELSKHELDAANLCREALTAIGGDRS